ncbi:MAG: hypothetical protein FJ318_03825 [SAR202 cluster bacterium]|nr:hypothetical protein [SAR202 cluster bacterium]
MYGERVNGVYMVFAECADPAQEREFNRWYTNEHLVDVLDTRLFGRASRFVAATPDTPKYLAVYETNLPLDQVMREMPPAMDKLRAEGRSPDFVKVVHRLYGQTMQPGMFTFAPLKYDAVHGLLVMASNPKTPGTDDAFNKWYDKVHMKDIAATKLHSVAHRFRVVNENPDGIAYVNLYENQLDDAARGLTGLDDFRQRWIDNGTYYADRVSKLRGAYRWLVRYENEG